MICTGMLLALSCPSAIIAIFWTRVFKGDATTALVISVATNLLSIVTIPATMLIAVGTAVGMDVPGMMLNLAQIILIPMIASIAVKKLVHINRELLKACTSKTELVLIVLLVWGSTAPGAAYVRANTTEFITLNAFMVLLLALAFTASYFLTRRLGHEQALSIGIATTVKNGALSLVVGLAAFGSPVLPPLIANLVASNLILVSAGMITK